MVQGRWEYAISEICLLSQGPQNTEKIDEEPLVEREIARWTPSLLLSNLRSDIASLLLYSIRSKSTVKERDCVMA